LQNGLCRNTLAAVAIYRSIRTSFVYIVGEHNFTKSQGRNLENYDTGTFRNIFEAGFEGVHVIDDLMDTMLHGLKVHLPLVFARKSPPKKIQKNQSEPYTRFCQADPNIRFCRFPSYKAARSLFTAKFQKSKNLKCISHGPPILKIWFSKVSTMRFS
jgi:hypothetical protein